ncbi:MAG: hypothetical protein GY829_09690 [Gammaproteobacteria bacterium]|nr:hypothetical protein [Gammaproteobacteria bacterium]
MNRLLTLILFLSMPALGIDITDLYISENTCPFEGCAYGEWHVQKETIIYSEQSIESEVLGKLEPATTVVTLTGNVHVVPGKAKIIGEPYHESPDLDPNKVVLILDYVGEGRTRIFQDGKFHITKIATDNSQCKNKSDWRRCWVKIIKKPSSTWWVKIKYKQSFGWVLIHSGNIKPIDWFS